MTEIDGLMEIKGKLKMKNIIILFLLLTGFVYSQSTTHFLLILAENRGNTLTLRTASIDFGTIDSSDVNNNAPFYLVNTGTGSLTVTGFTGLTSPYTDDVSEPVVIAANDSTVVTVTMDRNQSAGTYTDDIYITSTGGNYTIPVTGTIVVPPPLHNIWYVDLDATGDGSGSDWTNASTTVSGLNWNAIGAGDTVYVSGGTYRQDQLTNRQFTSDVVIAGAWQSGHNDRVTFRQQLPMVVGLAGSFQFNNCVHIKITNMTFDNDLPTTDASTSAKSMIWINSGSYITVDNDSLLSNGNGGGINVTKGGAYERGHHITISNCYIEVQENGINDAVRQYNIDPIWIGYSDGGNTIINNTIIQYVASAYSHPDFIQHYDVGSVNNYEYVIANNLMIYDNDTSSNSQGIYFQNPTSNRLLIYNNIMVQNAELNVIISITSPISGSFSLRVLNNTIVNSTHSSVGTDPGSMVSMRGGDTLIVKNNIYQVTGHNILPAVYRLGTDLLSEIDSIDADYNHFHYNLSDGYYDSYLFTNRIEMSQNSPYDMHTWDEWNTLGYDVNSDTGAVTFVNEFGSDIASYKLVVGSPGIEDGTGTLVTEYPFLATDILGVTRSGWNKGAIEGDTTFTYNSSNLITASIDTTFEPVSFYASDFSSATTGWSTSSNNNCQYGCVGIYGCYGNGR